MNRGDKIAWYVFSILIIIGILSFVVWYSMNF